MLHWCIYPFKVSPFVSKTYITNSALTSNKWNSPQTFLEDYLPGYNPGIGLNKIFHFFHRLATDLCCCCWHWHCYDFRKNAPWGFKITIRSLTNKNSCIVEKATWKFLFTLAMLKWMHHLFFTNERFAKVVDSGLKTCLSSQCWYLKV